MAAMARAATTSDAFNAVAEPQRRRILALLADGERSVGDIADALELNQPQVSKHLKVLKEVDLVRVESEGRYRRYRLHGEALRPIHDWISNFERFWQQSFDRLDDYLTELQAADGREREESDDDDD